jgi:hypothetical protein
MEQFIFGFWFGVFVMDVIALAVMLDAERVKHAYKLD